MIHPSGCSHWRGGGFFPFFLGVHVKLTPAWFQHYLELPRPLITPSSHPGSPHWTRPGKWREGCPALCQEGPREELRRDVKRASCSLRAFVPPIWFPLAFSCQDPELMEMYLPAAHFLYLADFSPPFPSTLKVIILWSFPLKFLGTSLQRWERCGFV